MVQACLVFVVVVLVSTIKEIKNSYGALFIDSLARVVVEQRFLHTFYILHSYMYMLAWWPACWPAHPYIKTKICIFGVDKLNTTKYA